MKIRNLYETLTNVRTFRASSGLLDVKYTGATIPQQISAIPYPHHDTSKEQLDTFYFFLFHPSQSAYPKIESASFKCALLVFKQEFALTM